jgi:phosphoribosylanthranilate isomerase
MAVRVKICGLTNEADAVAAVEAGADLLGFVLYPQSPRYVEPAVVHAFNAHLPSLIQRVAVTVNLTPAEVEMISRACAFDIWQLHGDETPAGAAALAQKRLFKALALPRSADKPSAKEYDVEAFLLDTPSQQYGGTGQTFDWSLAVEFQQTTKTPVFLSGGLNPENVARAINQVHPYGVDVSSGVEAKPGKKDHAKLRDFIQICKSL